MMPHCFLLLLSIMLDDSFQDEITPRTNETHALEGNSLILSCSYTTSNIRGGSLQWYRQYPKSKPEFLILIFGTKDREVKNQLTVKHNTSSNEVHLELSSAKVTDSAVYYCALQPTVTGNP